MARKRKADCTPEELRLREVHAAAQRRYRKRHKDEKAEEWRAYRRAWAKRSWASDPRYREMRNAERRRWRAKGRNQREAVSLFDQVLALIPPQIEAKFDIASEAMILLLEGKALTPEDAIKIGRKKHYKLFSQFDKKTVSLDAPLRDGRSLHDIIAGEAA